MSDPIVTPHRRVPVVSPSLQPVTVTAGGITYLDGPTLDRLEREIHAWQQQTFPHATPASVAKHLAKEALELMTAPTDAEEIADVFHLVVAAARANGYSLAEIVQAKFTRNRRRTWKAPDADGVVEHASEGEDAEDTAR